MTRILLFLMKSIVALLASLGLLLVLTAAGGWFFWQKIGEWHSRDAKSLPDVVILRLDLADGLRDGPASGPLALAGLDSTPSIKNVIERLEEAAGDERVKGVVLRLGYGGLSPAQAQELRAALMRFRAGKGFALGFAETFGEAGSGNEHYSLATALDEVWLQPSGDLDLIGYQLEQPFVHQLLRDWNIEVRAAQRQQWKGLADFALRDSLSPPVRENLQSVVTSLYEQLAETMAQGRDITLAEARERIDSGPYSARAAHDSGLIDRLGYWEEFEEAAQQRAGETALFVDLMEYRHALPRQREEHEGGQARIALLHLRGPIQLGSGRDAFGSALGGAEQLARDLRRAAEDEDIAAIVLRIDSPGGSAVASDMLWHSIKHIRTHQKPVVISLGTVAASGGYYVAVAGHPLLAQPGSLTGSIGVAGGKPVLRHFWPRIGLAWDGVKAGKNAGFWSLNRDFSPAQWRRFQEFLDRTYADFVRKVSEGRALEGEALEAVVGGRLFTGEQALAAGMIDALGGLPEAAAARAAGQDPERGVLLLDYPERAPGLDQLLDIVKRESGLGDRAAPEELLLVTERLGPLLRSLMAVTEDPRAGLLREPHLPLSWGSAASGP